MHTGPICSTVRDAAIVYDIIAGPDPEYPVGLNQPHLEQCQFLASGHISGLKIGIDQSFVELGDKEVVDICLNLVEQLASNHGAKVTNISIPELEEARVAHGTSILVEMASFMNREKTEFAHLLNPETRIALVSGGQFTAYEYLLAQQQRTRTIKFLKDIFNDIDIIVTPTTPMTALRIHKNASLYGESDATATGCSLQYCSLANLSGIPAISVPAGYDSKGLPVGIQFMAPWWAEQQLFRVALTAEKYCVKRKPKVHYSVM